jgi:TatD DNase family protein
MIIDTHAHLTWDSFKPDFKEVLNRANKASVKTIINVGPDVKRWQEVINLDCHPLISYSAIGLHPHEALKLRSDVSIHDHIEKLELLCTKYPEKIIAVGECGLDYHFAGIDYFPSEISEKEQKQLQKKLFVVQIELAKKLHLPLIIHCRDSWEDIFLPELHGTRGVFHSFTGNQDQARQVLNLDYYLGFTCIVTYPKNEHLREIIKSTPINRILTETDCPFLPPQTKRGQRSEPADVREVIETISEMKNLSFEEVSEITSENAKKLFNLA